MSTKTEIVVIGGGYAGVMAANRLTQRDDMTVTLINPRPQFVERIRLHQLAVGTDDAVVDYREVLNDDVGLVVDTVTRIDSAGRRVESARHGAIGYDYLIYAVGSDNAGTTVPGASEFAYPIATLEDAQRLQTVLDTAPAAAPVTVVGAGPAGIEVASELAEQGRKVTLVCGGVLGPYLHPRGRRSVAGQLAKLGVTVLEGSETKVTAVSSEAVRLGDNRTLPSRVTVWTAGFGVPDLARRSGLPTDSAGRLRTDETLTCVDDDRIVAAGDSAAPSDMPLRMSCQAAMPLGARAADTVLSRLDGAQPAPLEQAFGGQCISIGRGAGIFQFAHRYDVAVGFHIGGRAGAKVKEFVCQGIVKHLAGEAGKPGSYRLHRISGGSKRQQQLEAARGEALVVP